MKYEVKLSWRYKDNIYVFDNAEEMDAFFVTLDKYAQGDTRPYEDADIRLVKEEADDEVQNA